MHLKASVALEKIRLSYQVLHNIYNSAFKKHAIKYIFSEKRHSRILISKHTDKKIKEK